MVIPRTIDDFLYGRLMIHVETIRVPRQIPFNFMTVLLVHVIY